MAVVVEGKIVALGGEKSNAATGTFAQVEEYDPVTNTWSSLPPMPQGKHGIAATRLGNGIFKFCQLRLTSFSGIFLVGGGPQTGLSTSSNVWIYYYKSL